jgi:predicted adenine nucleotide alpha hydrolase (AANH) superfamily ATPase
MWLSLTEGYEDEPEGGKRCEICYAMRLEETAKFAREEGFDSFGAVLTISPHKDARKINKIGKEIGEKYSVPFLESDFKKEDGFKKSVEMSKNLGLYRQDYCGCIYSKIDKKKRT